MFSCITGVTVVLKFLKFQNCPEIVLKLQIVLKFSAFGKNVLILFIFSRKSLLKTVFDSFVLQVVTI